MALSEALLPEFDQEMANTRRTLERVPEGNWDWKPHQKSTTLGSLATHLATLPSWAVTTIGQSSLDLAPGGTPLPGPSVLRSRKELLEVFDKNVAEARRSIAQASDGELMKPWSLLCGGKALLTHPRAAVLRTFVMNHNVHHRAQLGVYLRLNNVPVPAIYGPSADEGGF